jgi:hypothetical protein
MDELERLVDVYRARDAASARSKLDALMDLERIRDPRVVPFLLSVLADTRERDDVRMHVVRQLRNESGVLVPANRPAVSRALRAVVDDLAAGNVRLQAALALGDFIDVDGVLATLTELSLARDESIDLRYAAFTSIERAGPTPECIAVLRHIAGDDALGDAAHSVLSAWHVA